MAVVAPMPSASVSTATAVKPGFFSNWRKAKRRSFITQCHHGLDFGGPARGNVTSQQSCGDEPDGNGSDGRWVTHGQRGDRPRQKTRHRPSGAQSKSGAEQAQAKSIAQYQPEHIAALRAQRQANADFAGALNDRVRGDSVDADGR